MEPKYKRIKSELMKIINNHDKDTRIPSERAISDIVDGSRMTVRKAVDELVSEGYLYRNGNLGTFVSKIGHRKYINSLHGFTREVILSGGTPTNRVISLDHCPADEDTASKLEISVGDPIVRLERLRLKDNVPMMVDVSYFPVHLIGNLTREMCESSLYRYFEDDLGIKIANSVQEFTAIMPEKKYADILEISENQPIIRVKHKTFLDSGAVIEYAIGYKNSDKYQLLIKAVRD